MSAAVMNPPSMPDPTLQKRKRYTLHLLLVLSFSYQFLPGLILRLLTMMLHPLLAGGRTPRLPIPSLKLAMLTPFVEPSVSVSSLLV